MRKFEVVTAFEDKGINLPARKTKKSAGYDIEAATEVYIYPKHMMLVPTGLKVTMEDGEYLDLRIRSGLSIKQQAMLVNGAAVIDGDYYNNPDNEGHIMVPLINLGVNPISINKGDRIAQGIFTKYYTVEDDEAKGERNGGMGSTGMNDKETKKIAVNKKKGGK